MKRYLICYDIADPRRLIRVHKICREYGVPLQYSVFFAELDRRRLENLIMELRDRITADDDVRIYPLQNKAEGLHMGRSALPEGLVLGMDSEWAAIAKGGAIADQGGGRNQAEGDSERQ